MNILSIDMNKSYAKIADALNDVFDYKTKDGTPMERAGKGCYKIQENKDKTDWIKQ